MAGVTGLEPAASGVTGQRSNQLSYTPACAVVYGRAQGKSSINKRQFTCYIDLPASW